MTQAFPAEISHDLLLDFGQSAGEGNFGHRAAGFAEQVVVVVPWNDMAAVQRAFETWRGQFAAVITEGIGH